MQKHTLTLVIMLAALKGIGQSKNFIDQPFVETSAIVDSLVIPDRIYLNILFSEKDTKGNISVEELESRMETTLKNLGIDTRTALVLNDLGSNFKRYFLKDPEILKSKNYSLLVYDAQMAGKVIVALEEIDISNIRLERTEYSKIGQLKLALKAKAISLARLQADVMCLPLNQSIGQAIYIGDYSDQPKAMEEMAYAFRVRGVSAVHQDKYTPADIEFQKIKVESTVSVKFVLKP